MIRMLLGLLLLLVPGSASAAPFASDRISVRVEGEGPDVVLVPGLGSSPQAWASTVAAVPGYRYHLVQVKGFAGLPAEPAVSSLTTRTITTTITPLTTASAATTALHDDEAVSDAENGEEEFDRRVDREPVPDHLIGKCILKGSCDTKQNLLGDVAVPCVEKHDPYHMVDQDAREVLMRLCPSLFLESEDPLLCCSTDQVYEMETNFQMPDQLGLSRCPSCQYNWRLTFCEMTCSPRQSEFIQISNFSLTPDRRRRADAIITHVPDYFPDKLLDSCSGVQGLAAGQKLLDLLCGSWGASQCTGQRWLQFLGLDIDSDGQSPYQIDFVYHSASETSRKPDGSVIVPMSTESTVGCSEKAPRSAFSCSCNDCEATCALKELPAEARILPADPEAIAIIGMSGAELLSVLLFLFLMSLIVTYFMLKAYHKKRTQNRKCLLSPTTSRMFCLFAFHFSSLTPAFHL
jgi:Niemann-Pick C1 protein